MGRGGRLSLPGGGSQRQAECWYSLARVWGGKQGAPDVPSKAIEALPRAALGIPWDLESISCTPCGGRQVWGMRAQYH